MNRTIDDLLVGIYHGVVWFDDEEEAVVRKSLQELYDCRIKPPVESGSIDMKDPGQQKEANGQTADLEQGPDTGSDGAAKEIPHTITEDDLKNNPDLAEEGIHVGDEIGIPAEEVHE